MDGLSLATIAKLVDTASTVAILLFLFIALVREWIVVGRTARREIQREKEITADYKQAWMVAQATSQVTQEQFRAIMASLDQHFRDEHRDKRESV